MRKVLLAGRDIAGLKLKTTQEPYSRLWQYLVSRWEGFAAREDVKNGEFYQANLAWPGCTPRIVDAALIHLLDGRADALAYVEMLVKKLADLYAKVGSAEDLARQAKGQTQAGLRPYVLSHGEIALAADLLRDQLNPEIQAAVARLMNKICIPFSNFDSGLAGYSSGGNVIACQNINAGICALAWGEESGFTGWEKVVDNASDNVRQYLRNGFDAHGFPYEGTGYGHSGFIYIYLYAQLLLQCGWRNLFAEEPVLGRIPAASQQMLLGDHSFAATTNDHGIYEPWSMWWLLLTAKHYRNPGHLGLWHGFQGPEHPLRPYGDFWPWQTRQKGEADYIQGEKPDPSLLAAFLWWDADMPAQPIPDSSLPTSQCSEGTGTATFRTSWKRDAVFAAMLGGGRSRACFGHAHADCGHIDIAVGGEYMAVDTGRYNWPEDQHSVVLVDGQSRDGLSAAGKGMSCDISQGWLRSFQRHRMLDYCVADSSHTKACYWSLRNFLFIRTGGDDGYIVLLDNHNADCGKSAHEYWWQLQCATTARIDITGGTTATVRGKSARIDCAFFQKPDAPSPDHPYSLEVRQDVKEWIWPYGKDQKAKDVAVLEQSGEGVTSVRRPRLLAVQKTLSCMMLSVLSPRREGQPDLKLRQVEVKNGIGVEVAGDSFIDTILAAPDHKLILSGSINCFSEFAVIRKDKAGNIIDTWSESGEKILFNAR